MRTLTAIVFSMLFLLSVVAVSADSVPLVVERAEIDDIDIEPFGENVLDLERNEEFELELELFAIEDVEDVEIRAFISGFEFSDVEPIADQIGPMDFEANVTYKRDMHLTLPDDVDLDDYKLRLVISDRNGDEMIYNYDLQVNTKRHDMQVEDVALNPGSSVKAGQALLASVRVENKGQKDEDDVKVKVGVPALGISAVDFIEEVESDEEEETEELFLRLPRCAEPGVYDASVEVWFNDGRDMITESVQVNVLENEACAPEPEPVVVVQEPQNETQVQTPEPASESTNNVRSALEIILLVLVALLVIVGLIIGFTRMREE